MDSSHPCQRNGNFYRGGEVAEVITAHEAPQRKAKTAGAPDEGGV